MAMCTQSVIHMQRGITRLVRSEKNNRKDLTTTKKARKVLVGLYGVKSAAGLWFGACWALCVGYTHRLLTTSDTRTLSVM